MLRAIGSRGALAARRGVLGARNGAQVRGFAKDVKFSNEARALMLEGVERLADAVSLV